MSELQHLVSASQLSPKTLHELFALADQMQSQDRSRTLEPVLRGRILATLFYEPSTRTRLSFEAAMQKLGGSVLSVENARDSSSAVKGETIADTVRVVSGYADAIAIRHFAEGTSLEAHVLLGLKRRPLRQVYLLQPRNKLRMQSHLYGGDLP